MGQDLERANEQAILEKPGPSERCRQTSPVYTPIPAQSPAVRDPNQVRRATTTTPNTFTSDFDVPARVQIRRHRPDL